MRILLVALTAASLVSGAFGQTTSAGNTVPREIGNRANGFSYEPRPGEVYPREVVAGIRPSPATQNATGHVLFDLDVKLLRGEGLDTSNVPNFAPPHTGQGSSEPTH